MMTVRPDTEHAMKRILTIALALLVLGLAAAGFVIYRGLIDVAADSPHWPPVYRLIALARERAIERSSRDIALPADLGDGERVRRGAGNYDAMCAGCHLAPGAEDSEIRKGLYPQPANLVRPDPAARRDERAVARQFWIVKHGIKGSGMPAWSQGGMEDGDIWNLVAFLQQLPTFTPQQYRQWVERSEGHSHGGADPEAAPAAPSPAAPRRHDHAGHRHGR